MKSQCEMIKENIGNLFACSEVGHFIRIRTPFMYPDGDYIDLFWKKAEGVDEGPSIFTDLGETVRWLRMQSTVLRRSIKHKKSIEDICMTHGVEFSKGMLIAHLKPGEDPSKTIIRLGQASLRVSDLWFTFRKRSLLSAVEEVADFLKDANIPFQQNVKLNGRSGKTWTVDFETECPNQKSLVYVLSTGSRGTTRRLTERVVAAWHDLTELSEDSDGHQFVSLFDDTIDVWTEEDFRQLESISHVAFWSQPDNVETLLVAA